jgi:leucyl-tRNA synthetase
MFMGPLERDKPWNTQGIEGVRRFLDRAWRLYCDDETDGLLATVQDVAPDQATLRVLHKTIDAVTSMTEDLRFNTAISQMMIFVNEMTSLTVRPRGVLEQFAILLAPYAPHMAEELWARLGHDTTLAYQPWPAADPQYLVEDLVTVVVQVNGKVRDQLQVTRDIGQDEMKALALGSGKVQVWTDGKTIVKTIYVPGKLVSVVVK